MVKFLLCLLKAQPDDIINNALDQLSVSRIVHLAKAIIVRVLRVRQTTKIRGYNLKSKIEMEEHESFYDPIFGKIMDLLEYVSTCK